MDTVRLPDPAADPVALYRLAHFGPHCDAQAAAPVVVGADIDSQGGSYGALPFGIEPAEQMILL